MFFIYLFFILFCFLFLLQKPTYRVYILPNKFVWKPVFNKNIYKKLI